MRLNNLNCAHGHSCGPCTLPEGLEGFRRGNSARGEDYFIKFKKADPNSPSVENNPYYPFQPFEVAKLAGDFDKWVA
jgi:hypothetical protein